MQHIFRRDLIARMKSGEDKPFKVSITIPKKINDDYVCFVGSCGMLSDVDLKAFGMDEIDAIEYAIHLLDILIFEQPNDFEVLWPDRSNYTRSKNLSYRWSL